MQITSLYDLAVPSTLRQEIVSTYSFASCKCLPVQLRCQFASYISDCYTIDMAVSTSTASIGRTKGQVRLIDTTRCMSVRRRQPPAIGSQHMLAMCSTLVATARPILLQRLSVSAAGHVAAYAYMHRMQEAKFARLPQKLARRTAPAMTDGSCAHVVRVWLFVLREIAERKGSVLTMSY